MTALPSDKTATFTTPSDRTVVVTRSFDAPRELVWKAWTDPQHIQHWLTGPPGWSITLCESDFRPGGAWRYGWKGPDGTEMLMGGVHQEISPPERLVSTESWGPEWPETLNTLDFTEDAGKTTLVMTLLYVSKEVRDKALASGMSQGMDYTFGRFEEYVATLA